MKKVMLLVMCLLKPIVYVQAQQYDETRTFDVIGLPGGDEITEALKIAIPLLVVGFLIAYIFMWGKSEEEKNNGSTMGCIGVIIMGIGFFCLLPLFAWIEAIGVTLISIISVIVIVLFIWQWITGNND